MLLSCQDFFKFLKLLPLISMFLYGNLVVKYKLYGGSNMSVVVFPSVSTLSGVLPWVISSLKHREGDFSRNLAFHPPISSTQTYCLSYLQGQYWESLVVLPLMFGLRFTPTRQGRSDTPLQRYPLHIYSSSCVIPCLRCRDEICCMPFDATPCSPCDPKTCSRHQSYSWRQ